MVSVSCLPRYAIVRIQTHLSVGNDFARDFLSGIAALYSVPSQFWQNHCHLVITNCAATSVYEHWHATLGVGIDDPRRDCHLRDGTPLLFLCQVRVETVGRRPEK